MPLPEKSSLEQKRLIKTGRENAGPPISRGTAAVPPNPTSFPSRKSGMPQPGHTIRIQGRTMPQRRIKNKQSNPNAVTPFNHRARFTKLKRNIHTQRQWALISSQSAGLQRCTGAAARTGHPETTTPPPSPSSSLEDCSSDTENTVAACTHVRTRNARRSCWKPVERAVAAMNSLYTRLSVAMTNRQYKRAGALKRSIRSRQLRLQRDSRAYALQDVLVGGTRGTSSGNSSAISGVDGQQLQTMISASGSSQLPPYRNFCPPSTWLGVGRHLRSTWVDQRTGRYPKQCSDEHLQTVVRYFMNGDVADLDTMPDTCAAMLPAPSSSPHSSALSRSQRAMKSTLFAAAYCTNVLTDALDDLTFTLLQGLYREQRDLKQKQPLHFKARQRYVVGFREVLKCLRAGRVRLVLLAADVETVELPLSFLPPPPPSSDTTSSEHQAASPAVLRTSLPTRKKAFHTLHEAVQLVQQLCGIPVSPTRDVVTGVSRSNTRPPPLCVSCMSRQRLSYALYAKGSTVGCVAVLQAEKNREALKAVMCYARYLANVYTAEMVARSMTSLITDPSVSPHQLSDCVEKHCAADIFALHHRLGRCLRQVEMLMESSTGNSAPSPHRSSRSSTSCVRRLGELLRETKRLEQRVSVASLNRTESAEKMTGSVDDDADAALRTYYRQQMQASLIHIQRDACAAQHLLAKFLSQSPTLAHLPVSCVGTAPQILECGSTAKTLASSNTSSHIYTDVVPPRVAYIPPAAVYAVDDGPTSSTKTDDSSLVSEIAAQGKVNVADKGKTKSAVVSSTSSASHPHDTPTAAGANVSAEDRIMEDIQQAISQMKNGALQMSALMAQETVQMKSASDLLTGGVAKTQANLRQLESVSYVADAGHVPWIMKCAPGMSVIWRTVLQPMWAFVKQVLVMAFIIAVTSCVLLLISIVPKPTVYRGQRRDAYHSHTSARNLSPAPVPLTTVEAPPPEMHASSSISDAAEKSVKDDLPVTGEVWRDMTTPPSHNESSPGVFSGDL